MAARVVPLLIALALAWRLSGHRRALGLAVGCVVLMVVFTIAYVYPINAVLFEQAGGENRPWLAIGIFRPEHRRRGLGTEAVELLCEHAFQQLGLSRLRLRVLAFNTGQSPAINDVAFGRSVANRWSSTAKQRRTS